MRVVLPGVVPCGSFVCVGQPSRGLSKWHKTGSLIKLNGFRHCCKYGRYHLYLLPLEEEPGGGGCEGSGFSWGALSQGRGFFRLDKDRVSV